jgi:hypothetical protein
LTGSTGNVAVGASAGSNATGGGNTLIGNFAGSNLTSGGYNIVIGSFIQAPSATGNNQLNIGDVLYGNLAAGTIGIGTTGPRSALDVNGSMISAPAVNNPTSTVDFSLGNIQYTPLSCQSFTLNNMKDGGVYTFVGKGGTTGTCTFSTPGFTTHPSGGLGPSVSGKHTMFNFTVVGSDVYVTWQSGL